MNSGTGTTAVNGDDTADTADTGSTDTRRDTADNDGGTASAQTRRARRWLPVVAVAAGYLIHLVWRLWLTRNSVAPIGHPDEDGYLVAARALVGGPGGYSTENGPFRRVGYPLLLSPVYLVGSDDGFAVYRRAQVLNAIIGSGLVPLAALFARRVLALPTRWAVGAALTAATLPAVVYYTGTAMTDAVLPTLVVAWLVLLHGWIATGGGRGRIGYALGAGAAAGLMYTVHVRGTMVVIVHCLVAVALLVANRRQWTVSVASIVAAAAVASLDLLGKSVLGDAMQLLGDNPSSQVTSAMVVNWGAALILLRVVGQLWYLSLATLGLGTVGVVAAAYPLFSSAERRRGLADRAEAARMLTVAAVLALTALVAFGSASSLPFGDHRITYFAYPRYVHFLCPVWLLIGFAALRGATARRLAALGASAAALFLLSAAVVGWRTGQASGYGFVAFDCPELLALSGQWSRFVVLRPTLVVLALFAAIVAATATVFASSRRLRRAAVLVLPVVAVLGVAAGQQIERNLIRPVVDVQYPAVTPRLVRDLHLGPGDVVAQAWQVAYPFTLNHARELYWQRPLLFDAAQPPPAEATVVIAPWYPDGQEPSWNGAALGMRQIGADPYHGWAVWRRG